MTLPNDVVRRVAIVQNHRARPMSYRRGGGCPAVHRRVGRVEPSAAAKRWDREGANRTTTAECVSTSFTNGTFADKPSFSC